MFFLSLSSTTSQETWKWNERRWRQWTTTLMWDMTSASEDLWKEKQLFTHQRWLEQKISSRTHLWILHRFDTSKSSHSVVVRLPRKDSCAIIEQLITWWWIGFVDDETICSPSTSSNDAEHGQLSFHVAREEKPQEKTGEQVSRRCIECDMDPLIRCFFNNKHR